MLVLFFFFFRSIVLKNDDGSDDDDDDGGENTNDGHLTFGEMLFGRHWALSTTQQLMINGREGDNLSLSHRFLPYFPSFPPFFLLQMFRIWIFNDCLNIFLGLLITRIPHIRHLDHLHVGGEEICHVEKFQTSIHGISPHEEEFQFFHTTDVEKCEFFPNLVKFHISPQDRCEEIWNSSIFLL